MTCLIVNFGSQYTHLIQKRLCGLGVESRIMAWHELSSNDIYGADAIILSGGPKSVYDSDARFDFSRAVDIPILGICYGMQLIAKQFGGVVFRSLKPEYGLTKVNFNGAIHDVWMSHGDIVASAPDGFDVTAVSSSGHIAGIEKGNIVGVQFHPEVTHTTCGVQVFADFFNKHTDIKVGEPNSIPTHIDNDVLASTDPIVCAISGGIDSLVCYKELEKHVSKHRLIPVTIDTGLLRQGEIESFSKYFDNLTVVDASHAFMAALNGVTDPETKRKIIGAQFIKELKRVCVAQKTKFLAQGTIYTDVIESSGADGTADIIKSHHNVGGIPKEHGLTLVEPLRSLYKDDVRKLAVLHGIPSYLVNRKPFPGPGLAIRIIGEITPDRVCIVRKADNIVTSALSEGPWQVFCVLLPLVKSVGVKGDGRSYESTIVIRSVDSVDGMTASVHNHNMYDLTKVADEIVNSVPGIGRVVFDLTSKPPGTIEWE